MSKSLTAEVIQPFDFIRSKRAVVYADIVDGTIETPRTLGVVADIP